MWISVVPDSAAAEALRELAITTPNDLLQFPDDLLEPELRSQGIATACDTTGSVVPLAAAMASWRSAAAAAVGQRPWLKTWTSTIPV